MKNHQNPTRTLGLPHDSSRPAVPPGDLPQLANASKDTITKIHATDVDDAVKRRFDKIKITINASDSDTIANVTESTDKNTRDGAQPGTSPLAVEVISTSGFKATPRTLIPRVLQLETPHSSSGGARSRLERSVGVARMKKPPDRCSTMTKAAPNYKVRSMRDKNQVIKTTKCTDSSQIGTKNYEFERNDNTNASDPRTPGIGSDVATTTDPDCGPPILPMLDINVSGWGSLPSFSTTSDASASCQMPACGGTPCGCTSYGGIMSSAEEECKSERSRKSQRHDRQL